MIEERIYIGRDNEVALQLLADGRAIDGRNVSRTQLRLTRDDESVSVDSVSAPSAFDWSAGSGVVRMRLGGNVLPGNQQIPAGRWFGYLVVFDALNQSGIVWGDVIKLEVVSETGQ